MTTDANGIKAGFPAVNQVLIFGEWQIATEQSRINMTIYSHPLVPCQYIIKSLLIIYGTLEGGTHRIDYQTRACRVKDFLQRVRHHPAHGVTLHKTDFEVLKITKAVVAVMSLIRDIDDGHLAGLPLQIIDSEINTVVVAVGSAHGDNAPQVIPVKSVFRSEILNDLTLEIQ